MLIEVASVPLCRGWCTKPRAAVDWQRRHFWMLSRSTHSTTTAGETYYREAEPVFIVKLHWTTTADETYYREAEPVFIVKLHLTTTAGETYYREAEPVFIVKLHDHHSW